MEGRAGLVGSSSLMVSPRMGFLSLFLLSSSGIRFIPRLASVLVARQLLTAFRAICLLIYVQRVSPPQIIPVFRRCTLAITVATEMPGLIALDA